MKSDCTQNNDYKETQSMEKKKYIKPNIQVLTYDTDHALLAASSVTGTLPDGSNINYGGNSSEDPNQGQGEDAKKNTNIWDGWERLSL